MAADVTPEGLEPPPDTTDLPTVTVGATPPPPLGRSWAFDFGSETFVRSRGVPLETRGVQTLLGWIDKCLHTERGALPIHPPGYGVRDLRSIIGRPISELSAQVIEEKFREALTFYPWIADVTGVSLLTDEASGAAYAQYEVVTDPPVMDPALRTVRTDLGSTR